MADFSGVDHPGGRLTVEQHARERAMSALRACKLVMEDDTMRRLRRIATISTAISALALLFLSNSVLVLPALDPNGIRPPCFPVFEVPFTNFSFQLPLWMWGLVPFSALALSTLAAVTCWIMLFIRWRATARLGDNRRPEVTS